ncbi:MAG: hypothetical protein R2783_02120 [Gelidibacter sp.]
MPVLLGFEIRGTGKSMLIAAIATRLKDHCDNLDRIRSHSINAPDTLISTFQGGSAEKNGGMDETATRPIKIDFAPIDDAENNLQERTAQGLPLVSKVIVACLRYLKVRLRSISSSSSISLFTNLPKCSIKL